MFRKSYWKKRFAPVLAGALVISSLLVPPGHAFAADPVTSEEQTVSPWSYVKKKYKLNITNFLYA